MFLYTESHWYPNAWKHFNGYFDEDSSSYPCQNTFGNEILYFDIWVFIYSTINKRCVTDVAVVV